MSFEILVVGRGHHLGFHRALKVGDFLRALVTADYELVPDDQYKYRVAIVEAFVKRGIGPSDNDAARDELRSLTAESLRAFCDGKLAHYKVPRYVEIVDEFPMTVTGKVRKVEMRETTARKLGLL